MRKQMISKIEEWCHKMESCIPFVNVKHDFFKLPETWDKVPSELIQEAFVWLEDIYTNEFAEFSKVKILCTDEIWASYRVCLEDVKTLAEVKLMNRVTPGLRMKLTGISKPTLLRKKQINRIINRKSKI